MDNGFNIYFFSVWTVVKIPKLWTIDYGPWT